VLGTHSSIDGYITSLKTNTYGDVFPAGIGGTYNTYFCDYSYCPKTSSEFVAIRSGATNSYASGIAMYETSMGATGSSTNIGSRLAYRGEYEIIS
jgi:hypothetical protein